MGEGAGFYSTMVHPAGDQNCLSIAIEDQMRDEVEKPENERARSKSAR